MSLDRGSRLGGYEISGPLGEGGMGVVYRATDSKLKREVAIKVLPEAFAAEADRLARFEREADGGARAIVRSDLRGALVAHHDLRPHIHRNPAGRGVPGAGPGRASATMSSSCLRTTRAASRPPSWRPSARPSS